MLHPIVKVQMAKMLGDPLIPFAITLQPLIYALLFGTLYHFTGSARAVPLSAFVGVGQMASWQVLLYAGGIIVRHEFNREKTVYNTLLSRTGMYGLWSKRLAICIGLSLPAYLVSLTVGILVFHVHVTWSAAGTMVAGVGTYFVSLYSIGLPLIFLLFLTVHGGRIIQTLSYPIFLLSGMIVSIDYFPAWVRDIAYVFPITWSTHWLQASLSGAASHRLEWLGALALSGIYLVTSGFVFRHIMNLIRVRGEVSL